MKKIIILSISVLVLIGLGFYASVLFKKKGNSNPTELTDFAVKDIETIDKIIITDNFGRVMEVKKSGKTWTDAKGGCIMQEGVEFVLDAIKNVELKGYLDGGKAENMKNLMISQHIKVEIFQNGDWVKTWYIGPPAPDHLGQIMLLESDETGKSDQPVIMQIKGVHGIIEPRFYADPFKWKCTNVFALSLRDIKRVDVKYTQTPAQSFTVKNKGNSFEVYQQNIPLPNVDTALIFTYLNKFKKVHYELPNYLLNKRQVDSLKRTNPFCILTVDEKNSTSIKLWNWVIFKYDKSTKLKMYRIPTTDPFPNEFGQQVYYDTEHFWCELPSGELVKCQNFVFNPLILGHIYFPLDLSSFDLGDYTPGDPKSYNHK